MARACVIVVNWNKRELLERMFSSLFAALPDDVKVALIENASTDGSAQMVRERFSRVNVLEMKANLGGAGGFRAGLIWALAQETEYVWLLDNDVVVCKGAYETLLEALDSDQHVAMAGSMVIHADDPTVVVEVGAKLIGEILSPKPNRENESVTESEQIHECDYLALCSLMARVEAIRQVGLVDERYFLFWDDMDWGYRFRAAGWRVVGCEASKVVHPGFSERGPSVPLAYYGARNRLLFLARASRGMQRLLRLANYSAFLEGKRCLYHFRARAICDAMRLGVADFWETRTGPAPVLPTRGAPDADSSRRLPPNCRVWLNSARPVSQMRKVITRLQEAGAAEIVLAVHRHRRLLFLQFPVEQLPCPASFSEELSGIGIRRRMKIDVVSTFWDQADTWHLEFGPHQIAVLDESGGIVGVRPANPLLGVALLLHKQAVTRLWSRVGWARGAWRALTRDLSWVEGEGDSRAK